MIVLIAVQEKQVAITDGFNAQPITGRLGIFQRANIPTEMKAEVEIVGVYSTMEVAGLARASHAAAHPGRRYVQKMAILNDNVAEPEPVKCIMCGVETGGLSYCAPCQNEHWRKCRDLDPMAGAPDPVPLVMVR